MTAVFRLAGAVRRDPRIEAWFADPHYALRGAAKVWFERMRDCGADVREILHDGRPTACVGDAAFGYVDAFRAHVNVGFFRGAALPDPCGLLVGGGKRMRHAKAPPEGAASVGALADLVAAAYADLRRRLAAPGA